MPVQVTGASRGGAGGGGGGGVVLPSGEVAFGSGAGITSSPNLKTGDGSDVALAVLQADTANPFQANLAGVIGYFMTQDVNGIYIQANGLGAGGWPGLLSINGNAPLGGAPAGQGCIGLVGFIDDGASALPDGDIVVLVSNDGFPNGAAFVARESDGTAFAVGLGLGTDAPIGMLHVKNPVGPLPQAKVVVTIEGNATQTANLLELKLTGGAALLAVTAAGVVDGSGGAGLRVPQSTVAALPAAAAGNLGTIRGVTDALGPVALAAVVGGGAVKVPVYSNGAAWIVM